MPFWDNVLSGVGEGAARGVNNYLEGDLKQKAEARAQAQFDTQQKQANLTIAKEQRGLDAQTFGTLQDQQVNDLRAAAAGDEAAGRRAAQRFPTIAQWHNQAFGLSDPIPAAPVGAPIFGTGHPAIEAQPSRTLNQQGPTPTGDALGQISTMPTVAQPAKAPDTSFTTDKTLAYLKGGLYLPPSAPQKLTGGETIAYLDPLTNQPTSTYTAPDPKGDALAAYRERDLAQREERIKATIASGKDSLELRQQLADIAEERLQLAKAHANDPNLRQDKALGAAATGAAAREIAKWDADYARAKATARARYAQSHQETDNRGHKHAPPEEALAAEAERAGADFIRDRGQRPGNAPDGAGVVFQGGKRITPFGNPNGAPLSVPPRDYNDTQVFSRVERVGQQVEQMGLGTITSRARSDERDAQAKREAGVPAGRNNHGNRNVLDFVPAAGKRAAAEEFFKARGGQPEWHGTHLHVTFPEIQSALPMSEDLAAFYDKHSIIPGAANA